jgi:hypothetical protein
VLPLPLPKINGQIEATRAPQRETVAAAVQNLNLTTPRIHKLPARAWLPASPFSKSSHQHGTVLTRGNSVFYNAQGQVCAHRLHVFDLGTKPRDLQQHEPTRSFRGFGSGLCSYSLHKQGRPFRRRVRPCKVRCGYESLCTHELDLGQVLCTNTKQAISIPELRINKFIFLYTYLTLINHCCPGNPDAHTHRTERKAAGPARYVLLLATKRKRGRSRSTNISTR